MKFVFLFLYSYSYIYIYIYIYIYKFIFENNTPGIKIAYDSSAIMCLYIKSYSASHFVDEIGREKCSTTRRLWDHQSATGDCSLAFACILSLPFFRQSLSVEANVNAEKHGCVKGTKKDSQSPSAIERA